MMPTTHPADALHADLLDIHAAVTRDTRREREKRAALRQYRVRCAIERFRENLQLQRAIGEYWLDV